MTLFQKYDQPEKLSGADAEVAHWRKLLITKRFGGRNAPFESRYSDMDPITDDIKEQAPAGVASDDSWRG